MSRAAEALEQNLNSSRSSDEARRRVHPGHVSELLQIFKSLASAKLSLYGTHAAGTCSRVTGPLSFFSGLTAQNSKTEKSAKTFIDVFQLFSLKKYDFKQRFCIKWDINKIFACLSKKKNKSIEVFYRFFSSALKTKVGGPCEVCALAEERYAVTSQSQHGDNFIHRKKHTMASSADRSR